MALWMSIDIAMQHCEVMLGIVKLALGLSTSCWDVWHCIGLIEHPLGHLTPCFDPKFWHKFRGASDMAHQPPHCRPCQPKSRSCECLCCHAREWMGGVGWEVPVRALMWGWVLMLWHGCVSGQHVSWHVSKEQRKKVKEMDWLWFISLHTSWVSPPVSYLPPTHVPMRYPSRLSGLHPLLEGRGQVAMSLGVNEPKRNDKG